MSRKTYFITQIEITKKHPEENCKQFYAMFHNLREAQKFVRNNITDIWETCFNYACIEGIEDSICPSMGDGVVYRQFYHYNRDKNIYEKCDTPEKYKNRYRSLAL